MSEKKSSSNNKTENAALKLTPSADDILGVSPAPSPHPQQHEGPLQSPQAQAAATAARRQTQDSKKTSIPGRPPMKSPSAAVAVHGGEGATPHSIRSNTRRKITEDAFSSSSSSSSFSSSDDDESSSFADSATSSSIAPRNASAVFSQSEFDKALLSSDGVPNTASFDVKEQDDGSVSDYLSQAGQSVISEKLNAEESTGKQHSTASQDERPPVARQQPRQQQQQQQRSITQQRPPSPAQSSSSAEAAPPPPPPAHALQHTSSLSSRTSDTTTMTRSAGTTTTTTAAATSPSRNKPQSSATNDDVSTGVLPDILISMRQKIESLAMFDSDMINLAKIGDQFTDDEKMQQETREQLKRSSQQSISASVLVSLAHKRYERRRLAAMEIEKVVRSLVQQNELQRVKAILLLLSDDYVRSTSEDARKGGVVALAACAIGLKKAPQQDKEVVECRDLILASVVHACQDHSQRVRYYATESLFNVLKAIPALAVQHFFILFEILRSLYADVDVDVRSGAQLLDKRLKEWIVGAINSGSFSADACVPIFARFVYMRNKATKRLTLSWLQELNEKLLGAPVLEFLHLFLSGIFAMVADPSVSIRESALMFLQGLLPKLLNQNAAIVDDLASMKVDFDKILQSLVTTLEHPDPIVRKVAMYWMSRIVATHMGPSTKGRLSAASISVRNSLPHVLPGILLSIGDTFHNPTGKKDSFLPDQTTRSLAEQTNVCLQDAVRRDGKAYVTHLDGFIMALREELDSPRGMNARHLPAVERKPYRMDVAPDGTGIESPGWFRTSEETQDDESMMLSRLCGLQWVIVLYESVVPDLLKAEYAREFISPIIRQLVDNPPDSIIFKSLEVLATITVPVEGEELSSEGSSSSMLALAAANEAEDVMANYPMNEKDAEFALDIIPKARRQTKSRDRQVFSALIQLHAHNHQLLADLSKVLQFMCKLQPPEFVFVSFAIELDRFVRKHLRGAARDDKRVLEATVENEKIVKTGPKALSRDLEFVSAFIQQMSHVLFAADETAPLRDKIRDCIGKPTNKDKESEDTRRARLFHIMLHSFSHNLASTVSLCLWGGAYRTASMVLNSIDPLDINLIFLVEIDKLIEMLERPLFRQLHVRMLESDKDPSAEGSGTMLFRALKSLLMIVPQSACYRILRDRLTSTAKFRQSALVVAAAKSPQQSLPDTDAFVDRVLAVRELHCDAMWRSIRSESLQTPLEQENLDHVDADEGRREWLGYSSKEEEAAAKQQMAEQNLRAGPPVEVIKEGYDDLDSLPRTKVKEYEVPGDVAPSKDMGDPDKEQSGSNEEWKEFWAHENNAAS